MHTLAFLSGLVWGLDYYFKGSKILVFANFAGVACELIVFIAYLYSVGTFKETSPAVVFARKWQYFLYHVPSRVFTPRKAELQKMKEELQKEESEDLKK